MTRTDVAWVTEALRLPPAGAQAVQRLARDLRPTTLVLPPDAEADALLTRLGLSALDRRETLAARPSPRQHPALWWLLERCHRHIVNHMGTTGRLEPWPALPPELGPVGRFLYVWVFIATVPYTRRYHRQRGIPDELSWQILAALGAQMANRRAVFGEGGLHTQDWLTHHFRGAIYALGRLHYERQRVWFDAEPSDAGQVGPRRGDHALGLHIPEGRLTPESVDESLHLARAFFARHFPDEDYRFATCVSWLLDEQLREYLPEDSNILRFQRRFQLVPGASRDDNATMVEFVFKRPLAELDTLPRHTTLQRAVIDHIRAGRTWRFRTGYFTW